MMLARMQIRTVNDELDVVTLVNEVVANINM